MLTRLASFIGLAALGVLGGLYGCQQQRPTTYADLPPQCFDTADFKQVGTASWYGQKFKGKKTASGEKFDPDELTAAHRNLPLGSKVKVTNLENGKETVVTVSDRGPYIKGRIIDVSKAAADELGIDDGKAKVRIQSVDGC